MLEHHIRSFTASHSSPPAPRTPPVPCLNPLAPYAIRYDTTRSPSAGGRVARAGVRNTHANPPTDSRTRRTVHRVKRSVGTYEEDDVEDDEQPSPELRAAGQ